jgi:hypothetical protein
VKDFNKALNLERVKLSRQFGFLTICPLSGGRSRGVSERPLRIRNDRFSVFHATSACLMLTARSYPFASRSLHLLAVPASMNCRLERSSDKRNIGLLERHQPTFGMTKSGRLLTSGRASEGCMSSPSIRTMTASGLPNSQGIERSSRSYASATNGLRHRRKSWLASVQCFFSRLRHLSVSRRASGAQGRVVGNHQQRERPFDENAAMYRRID